MTKRLSKRVLENARAQSRKEKDAEHVLYILQGLTPCPACKGSKLQGTRRETKIGERNYHFMRQCRWCSMIETPGYFTQREANDYGIFTTPTRFKR